MTLPQKPLNRPRSSSWLVFHAPRSPWLFLLAGALAFSSALTGRAADSSAVSTASVIFVHGESGGPEKQDSGTYDANLQFTDPDTKDLYFGNGAASVFANTTSTKGSTAEFPDLHANAHALGMGNSEGVAATAQFSDLLTFDSPAASTVKVFHFNFLITGSLSGNSQAFFNVQYGNTDSNSVTITSTPVGGQELTLAVPSDDLGSSLDGTSVGGTIMLSLTSSANNTPPNSFSTEDSVANFSNTVHLLSADALDANGDAVQGIFTDGGQILFLANTDYPETPEPATLSLLAAALVVLAFYFRRRLGAAR